MKGRALISRARRRQPRVVRAAPRSSAEGGTELRPGPCPPAEIARFPIHALIYASARASIRVARSVRPAGWTPLGTGPAVRREWLAAAQGSRLRVT